ncbi:MAG TPA: phosphomannomutase/phosphoglucomutase [Fredinandcohnia sp.]|nr:phosphomannomutase/phosphoglucomutase [Fredinandcohnia sp.]
MHDTVPAHIFREYDIRGLVDADLGDEVIERIARAFALRVLHEGNGPVVLGRDCRPSSERIAQAFARGLLGSGVDVVDVGLVPTPLVYYGAHAIEGAGGMAMVTGSHNPPEYNGLKLGVGTEALFGEEIRALGRRAAAGDFRTGAGTMRTVDLLPRYLDDVASRIRMGGRRLKVVVDAGNGVGGLVAGPLYERLGVEVVGMYLEPDGRFPHHHPDPTVEKNLEALCARVRADGADLGIAFDGDADRIGVIDETGRTIWGDELTLLFARAVLAEEPGATVISEVKCSQTLFDEIERLGGRAVMWKAGHSLIKAKMKETGAALAGEMSGHVFFAHRWYGFDDGPYAGARLLEILSRTDRPLSALLAEIPKTVSTPELRRDVGSEERKFEIVRRAVERFRAAGHRVIDVDGARVVFEDGAWGLVRASNTTPILVLRFEAHSEARLAEIRALFADVLGQLEREVA